MGRKTPPDPDITSTVALAPEGEAAPDPGWDPNKAPPKPPRRGEQIGRFVVLGTLGVGGMGVVVSAYDPRLDRKVALKLLRADVEAGEDTAGSRAHLLREAQAMAQLRHPNVVTVFEVGEVGDRVFLAMEYVAGGTLGQWCRARRGTPGGYKDILRAFVAAGRGVVAAHTRGLIHRDFKPSNVLVEDDRFQVTDFGIASIEGREVLADLGLQAEPTDLMVGTTPYMAPELIERRSEANEATDQFAFCVALFEALYGHRPFFGDTHALLSQSISDGQVQPPPKGHGVPDWVRQAVLRGLAVDPNNRWPSMARLVEALDSPDDAEVGRRTRVTIGVAVGLAFVLLPVFARLLGPPFDRSTYRGVVGQTTSLITLLLALAYASRTFVAATPTNRRAFSAVLVVLLAQLPLELGCAALGVDVVAADILHLVLWAASAAMFAVTVDRRFAVLAATYLLGLPLAIAWPAHHLWVLGLTNAALVAFVLLAWRPNPRPSP